MNNGGAYVLSGLNLAPVRPTETSLQFMKEVFMRSQPLIFTFLNRQFSKVKLARFWPLKFISINEQLRKTHRSE